MPVFQRLYGILFSLLLLAGAKTMYAQQPAYFMMGEEQFRGIQIYDVIQDTALHYWFATSDGIYWYNYQKYQKISCAAAKSNSVFYFVSDGKGAIYCHNLNNQVFKIEQQHCTLFYELQADETYQDVSLAVGENGHLLIACRKVIELASDGKVVKRLNIRQSIGQAYQSSDKNVYFHLANSDSLLCYRKGKFDFLQLDMNLQRSDDSYFILKLFHLGQQIYAMELSSKRLFELDLARSKLTERLSNKLFSRSGSLRIYGFGSDIWVAGTLPGVARLDQRNLDDEDKVFYPNYFISDVYKDHEGNILLSTFDKGVLVVSDLNIPDVIAPFIDDPIMSFCPDPKMGLLMGSAQGNIFQWQGSSIQRLNKSGQRPVEGIYSQGNSPLMIFDDGQIRALNKSTGQIIDIVASSLKSAVFISEREFYIGTNLGVAYCKWDGQKQVSLQWNFDLKARIYALAYDKELQKLYVASTKGLFCLDHKTQQATAIEYENNSLIASYLYIHNHTLYVCGKTYGVLRMQPGQALASYLAPGFLPTETVTKMAEHKGFFYYKTTGGLYQVNAKGQLTQSIHQQYGLARKRMIDFCFLNDTLWVSHFGGVQAIDLDYQSGKVFVPPIRVSNIFVNNQSMTLNAFKQLKSHQRKVQFELSAPTLRHQNSVKFHYKLKGYENSWNVADYNSNVVIYNALGPGTYTFEVKVSSNGVFSPTSQYTFSIARPYYSTWWFIALILLAFLGLVYLVYQRQLRQQQQKAEFVNALNSVKLTAIQSQMNPHFIFNALNSIQDLVLRGDIDQSYSFINKFSNLVRRTLDYSDKDFIEFEQEIKLIELYLSLEKLRFKDSLTYTIDEGGVEDILVPPILIQPFIENALLHGLLHQEGPKELHIAFSLGEVLTCTVTDNGVGREKAKSIRERQNLEHDSFSGKAIKKRFEILEKYFGGSLGFQYEDLYQDGQAVGTKVVLHIPVKHLY
jgi:ligand-binding sensor domain-containing protein/cbb3-type cytochrome oxidase subunit 3